MHHDFCALEKSPVRRGYLEAIAAPRGNAKTTYKALFKVIHSIVYEYEKFIVVLGYSQSEAMLKLKDIRDELLSNDRLIEVYGSLLSQYAGSKEFVTYNGVKLVARGRGGQVRGLKFRSDRPHW